MQSLLGFELPMMAYVSGGTKLESAISQYLKSRQKKNTHLKSKHEDLLKQELTLKKNLKLFLL